jgi:transcriptional regulator of acetoin/glycerol metabolism
MQRQRAIRSGWEEFVKTGRPPHGLPQALVASWARSQTCGVPVGRREAPLSGETEIFRRRVKNVDLVTAARPALERSSHLLVGAASMMILADASGFIMETAGDPRIIDAGKRNHLEIGGRWEEGIIGTNAIGTALADAKPVQIIGAEHFCEDIQRWTCAASPVHHPIDGELLGIVDISGPAAAFNPQSLALVMALAQEIQASLGRVAKLEHEILLRHFVSKRSIWLSEEILVVDRRGVIVHSPQKARYKLDTQDSQGLFQSVRQMIGRASSQNWESNCQRLFPNASLEVVKNNDKAIGCLIVLHQSRGRATTTASTKPHVEASIGFEQILGRSPAMHEARERARKLAVSTLPILIEGETGVGKELFARAIAGLSSEAPFVPVNCGGIPRDLIASELFGYAKGAFTGADENGRAGKIEQADGGVLCLDEIGEMPLELQPYLLRVLEDGVVYRVGDHKGRRVGVRVLSMTNRDLIAEVDAGRFRRDLYYRLAAARIRIPPLRERGDDILLLAEHFATLAAARLGRPAPTFGGDVLSLLSRYSWPGNVRELRNVVDAMVTLNDSGHIGIDDLPPEIVAVSRAAQQWPISPVAMLPSASDLKSAERLAILTKLRECGGNVTETARRLGIARSTLYARLAEYGELHSLRPRCFVRHLDSRTSNRPNHERSQTQHTD